MQSTSFWKSCFSLIEDYSRTGDSNSRLLKDLNKKIVEISRSIKTWPLSDKCNKIAIENLNILENKINDLSQYGVIFEYFRNQTSFPEKLAGARDRFLRGLLNVFLRFVDNKSVEAFFGRPTPRALAVAKNVRKRLHQLGGANVKINMTGENVTLEGAHITASAFKDSLKKCGARSYTLKITKDKTSELTYKGIAFPPFSDGDNAINWAYELLIDSGWRAFTDEQGFRLLIADEDADELHALGLNLDLKVNKEHALEVNSLEFADFDLREDQDVGTVLLTTGGGGVYEANKREILSFLMRGMNVMTFNYRGFGGSTGLPTERGLERDLEAVYQYLKTRNVSDEKILVKGLCLSGGPSTNLAANHSKVNLFLDQSYGTLREYVRDRILSYINKFVKEFSLSKSAKAQLKKWAAIVLSKLVLAAVMLLTPSWNIKNSIRRVSGHVGILQTKQDKEMDFEKTSMANFGSIFEQGQALSSHLYVIDGDHAVSWTKASEVRSLIHKIPRGIVKKVAEKRELQKMEARITDMYKSISTLFEEDKEALCSVKKLLPNPKEKLKELSGYFIKFYRKNNVASRQILHELVDEFLMSQNIKDRDLVILKRFFVNLYIYDDCSSTLTYIATSDKEKLLQRLGENLTEKEKRRFLNAVDICEKVGLLKNYRKALNKRHHDPKSYVISLRDVEIPEGVDRKMLEKILNACTKENKNPFMAFYDQMIQELDEKTMSPEKIIEQINGAANGFSDSSITVQLFQFIDDLEKEVHKDPALRRKRYEGRRMMDNFLLRARLVKRH